MVHDFTLVYALNPELDSQDRDAAVTLTAAQMARVLPGAELVRVDAG